MTTEMKAEPHLMELEGAVSCLMLLAERDGMERDEERSFYFLATRMEKACVELRAAIMEAPDARKE